MALQPASRLPPALSRPGHAKDRVRRLASPTVCWPACPSEMKPALEPPSVGDRCKLRASCARDEGPLQRVSPQVSYVKTERVTCLAAVASSSLGHKIRVTNSVDRIKNHRFDFVASSHDMQKRSRWPEAKTIGLVPVAREDCR
jgi:hypothetical protein